MLNLNNIHAGKKLIKQILDNNNINQPWSREKQLNKINQYKNIRPKSIGDSNGDSTGKTKNK